LSTLKPQKTNTRPPLPIYFQSSRTLSRQ